jgi:hypothetical protein
MAIDLWIDSLDALAICFLCDEFTEGKKSNHIDSVNGRSLVIGTLNVAGVYPYTYHL